MKKIPNLLVLITLLIPALTASAETVTDYVRVDNTVRAYPISFSSPEKLADRINTDFTTDETKVRAIFTWIAVNVKYDLGEYQSRFGERQIAYSFKNEEDRIAKELKFRHDLADKTLRSHKGVCQGYTALFHTLCDFCNIKCIDITGTSKTHPSHIGKLPKASDHAWNAVRMPDGWRLIDVTWGAGAVSTETGKYLPDFNDAYFFTTPDVFFLNHFPDDKRLLMTNSTEQDFAALPLYYGDYLRADYEIVSPQEGTIGASDPIQITFQGLSSQHEVAYVFSSEGIIKFVKPQTSGSTSQFLIPTGRRSKGYLTVYVDRKSVVTYKIR